MASSYSNKEVFTLSSVSCILCECFYNLVCIFVDTFLIARILSLTNYSLLYIGIFYISQYFVQMFLSVILNFFIKKLKLNYFVTIGAVVMITLVMSVYFLSDDALITFLPLLGLCYSLGSSFFWLGQNNLATIAVSSRYQVRFFTVKKTSVTAIKTVVPFILGSSISAMGFQVVAIIMAVFTVLLFIFSLFVKANKKITMQFKLINFTKSIFKDKQKHKLLWVSYITAFFYGISITILSTLFTYMVCKYTKNDMALGSIKTIITGISLLCMFSFLKFYRKKHAGWYCYVPMIVVPIAGAVMLCFTNIYTIIAFFALYIILSVNLTSLTDMRRAGVIRMLDMHSHVLEHNAIFEIIISFSRFIGFGLCVVIGLFDTNAIFIVGMAIFLLCFMGYCLITFITEKLLVNQDKEWKKNHMVHHGNTAM